MKELLKKALLVLVVLVLLAASSYTAYSYGRLADALQPTRPLEQPMCLASATDLRTGPTGFIIAHIEAGKMVWFLGLDLPFARVAFYDGDEWLIGTIAAHLLKVCE